MIFEILKFENRQFYFKLKTPNGQVITSDTYQTKNGAKKGVRVMKRNIFLCKIEDKTKENVL